MNLFNKEEQTTDIWRKYETGRDQHRAAGIYKNAERCHRFYEGDQWHGLQSGGEELPVLNFIRPVCTYKIATVAMNTTAIIYNTFSQSGAQSELCAALNALAARLWEKNKMDSVKWEIVKNACISGDAYLYSYDAREPSKNLRHSLTPRIKTRVIDKTRVYFANEQNPDISEQEWIIIAERVPVAKVKALAKSCGISNEQAARITADDAEDTEIGTSAAQEVKSGEGKCTSLLFMRKTNEGIEFCRSVRSVVYQPMQLIPGLDVYPLCGMRWLSRTGSARGIGVVEGLIANQIEVNRTIARRALMVKKQGFSSMAVDADKIENPEALGKIGSVIHVRNLSENPISSIVQYLTPAPMTSDAAVLQNELITRSRELEGASEAATGQVNPERASGEAIKAARDQSAMSLTEQSAAYKQFCEDLALCWYRLWSCYSEDGVEIEKEDGKKARFSKQELDSAEIDIKIDISPTDPYSVLSREMAVENALARKHITFEEYVEILDGSSGVPKDKFVKVLKAREAQSKKKESEQAALAKAKPLEAQSAGMESAAPGNAEAALPPELLAQLMGKGGVPDAMPQM